jgi:F0F1-type ATP synthase membrane subunit b/b'
VALDASKKVLQRELTKQDNDKIVEDFIKGLRN